MPFSTTVTGRAFTPSSSYAVIAVQIGTAQALARRIEDDRQEIRQHRPANRFREGLALGFVLLPMTFDPVAEDLMKEDARRSPGQNRWTDERLYRGGLQQLRQIIAGTIGAGADCFRLGQTRQVARLKIFEKSPGPCRLRPCLGR